MRFPVLGRRVAARLLCLLAGAAPPSEARQDETVLRQLINNKLNPSLTLTDKRTPTNAASLSISTCSITYPGFFASSLTFPANPNLSVS